MRYILISAVGALLATGSAQAEEIVIATTGGAFEKAMAENFFKPFEAETGIKVRAVSANVSEQITKLALMSKSGKPEWDIVYLQDLDLKTNAKDYLTDLGDCSSLPNVAANGVTGACLRYGVISDIGGGVLAYNKDAFEPGKGPTSWSDFWNVSEFPATRALPDIGLPWWDMTIALRAAGVPREQLFPIDTDKAYSQLDTIKPEIAVWWKTGDQSQNMFRSGEVEMSLLYSGRALQLKNEGVPLEIVWTDAVRDVGAFAVVKDAPNSESAKKFLNYFYSRPDAHTSFGKTMFYGSPVKGASQAIGLTGESLQTMIETDPTWVEEHRETSLERWLSWLAN